MRSASRFSNNKVVIVIFLSILLVGSASFLLIKSVEKAPVEEEEIILEDGGVYTSFFACPVKSCTDAISTYSANKSNYLGVGFKNLGENSDVLAVVSGIYSSTESEEGVISLVLRDKDGIETTYIFRGKANEDGDAEKGEKVGVLGGGTVSIPESNEEFSLFIKVIDSRTGNPIRLGPDKTSRSLRIL